MKRKRVIARRIIRPFSEPEIKIEEPIKITKIVKSAPKDKMKKTKH